MGREYSTHPYSIPPSVAGCPGSGSGSWKCFPATAAAQGNLPRAILEFWLARRRGAGHSEIGKTRIARPRMPTLIARRFNVELRVGRCALKRNESLQVPTIRRLNL